MKLDDIGHPGETHGQAAQRERTHDPDLPSRFGAGLVSMLVEMPPLDGVGILRPETLDMDERGLTVAVHDMLERRDGQKVVFGVHQATQVNRAISSTPLGRPSPSTLTV